MRFYFPFFIAWRYFFSKKKKINIINILSILSLLGILLSTIALIIVVSIFNGFEEQILGAYNPINPDLRIETIQGKSFENDTTIIKKIKEIDKVDFVLPVIKEQVILEFENRILLAYALGISDDFRRIYSIDSLMRGGAFYTKYNNQNYAVLGYPLAAQLRLGLFSDIPFSIYALKRDRVKSVNLSESFNKRYLRPAGYFDGIPEFSSEHLFVDFDFAKKLFHMKNHISFLDLKLKKGANEDKVIKHIKKILGAKFLVKNRFQLNETLFRILKIEKMFVFATLILIFIIASFNIVGALSMIISDKKADISTLEKLGATKPVIVRIFIFEALLIGNVGTFLGVLGGLFFCFLQKKYGFIVMHMSSEDLPFPVVFNYVDILLIILLTVAISFLIAGVVVKKMVSSLN